MGRRGEGGEPRGGGELFLRFCLLGAVRLPTSVIMARNRVGVTIEPYLFAFGSSYVV